MSTILQQLSALRADNALRVSNWRWARAELLSRPDCPRMRSMLADPLVSEARDYLLAQKDPQVQPHDIPRRWPELHAAADIYERADDVRWVLEALIVADVDPARIAEQMPVTEATVRMYERVFFDVRDRLKLRWFLATTLVGAVNGKTYVTRDKMMKMLAYVGSQAGMGEELLFGFFAQGVLSAEARELVRQYTFDTALRATATALLNNDPMHPTYPQLVGALTVVDKNEREEIKQRDERNGGDAEHPLAQVMGALNVSIFRPPLTAEGTKGETDVVQPEIAASEPRAHELLAQVVTMDETGGTHDTTSVT
jgi:hypothetical protein